MVDQAEWMESFGAEILGFDEHDLVDHGVDPSAAVLAARLAGTDSGPWGVLDLPDLEQDGPSRSEDQPRSGPPAHDPDEGLDSRGTARFEALRKWRDGAARGRKVPPYIILNDKHLRELARRAPGSLAELGSCPGLGPNKLDRYGEEILDVLADTL